ncbi:DUF308 domain-containing protein [Vagococcus sp. BWB3-3]|uniref:DUF308 domain-containing protein n=1 Tax=Vagococcus allomyrinae TaxID=2794353 RepID=A0A940PCP5_9ENTE|nr:DUF308 domain-containing protein [Vagococcus allomyrinae]MBP1041076.1 DUF308 domain-containing protein [Vagococcus allomyrinae]
MLASENRKFGWGNFLLGLLFIMTALVAFRDPAGSLVSVTVFIGLMAIAKGCFDIFLRNKVKALTGAKATVLILVGVLDIILGLILLFNIKIGLLALPYIFAIWFIADSISGLFSLDLAKVVSPAYYWFSFILNIIGILIGFSLLFNPVTSALTLSFLVGFYLLMFGIMNIVEAFSK